MLRSTRNIRPIGIERLERQTTATPTDILIDNVHDIAIHEMLPSIRQQSQNAVSVDRIVIKFYQQINVGRLCSCYKKEYDSPESNCLVCFAVGRVGGYNVFGTQIEVIDTTYPSLTLVNTVIDDNVWPWKFKLIEGAIVGYVEALIDVPSMVDVNVIKLYNLGTVTTSIRNVNSTAWHRLNRSSLTSLSAISKQLVIRIGLTRKTIENDSPYFTHLYLRYNLINKNIYADMPKIGEFTNTDNFALTGLQTTQAFITSSIPICRVQDFFKDLRNNFYWKITNVVENAPLGVLTSWDLEVRSVESFEIYRQIP